MRHMLLLAATMILTACATSVPQAPVAASPCAGLHTQVMNEAQRRLDAAAFGARQLAGEGEKLCLDKQVAEGTKKYEEAGKLIGIELAKEDKK